MNQYEREFWYRIDTKKRALQGSEIEQRVMLALERIASALEKREAKTDDGSGGS